ncbi:MAG: hypothetical protein F6K40_00580 [Okeania sp. SIO3I5]|uniref:hypothetical protein n=1 Tax=Okeania sp. SIO3I5 TaxID=2607805 RepID=UPI0013B6720E|nr:hypothetical protein [Okeania sp. SIO3I5]NEQ34883.1 hypothetical protein [Okeania sp. SIO3I5]
MIPALHYLEEEVSSWDEMCSVLGEYLGLERPISKAVLRRARQDDRFAGHLFTCRYHADLLKVLLADPRNEKYQLAEDVKHQQKSNLELIGKASAALLKWGKAGFARVDEATFESRFNICQACEYLIEPPDKLVYKITLSQKSDLRVCSACGCVAARKARLPTETCPVADPSNPSLNRWGDPISEAGTN